MANGTVELLLADAEELILGALLGPQWGVYLNGTPVIQPATAAAAGIPFSIAAALTDLAAIAGLIGGGIQPAVASTVEFEFAQDWPISNYPQEQGAFQSYNKVTLPFDVKLRLVGGGSIGDAQTFLQTCLAIANSFALFDVVTPELTFTSCSVTHISWHRAADRGATLIQVDLWFQQINVTSTTTFQNTQQPGNASPTSLSNVQPMTPNQQVDQAFSSYTVN